MQSNLQNCGDRDKTLIRYEMTLPNHFLSFKCRVTFTNDYVPHRTTGNNYDERCKKSP